MQSNTPHVEGAESYPITLKNLDTSKPNNNYYTYNLPQARYLGNKEVTLQSGNMFRSWYNVSARIGNNRVSYIWNSGGPTSLQVDLVIPDGVYSITDLSQYIQSAMYANGHVLLDSSGNIVYYLAIIPNATYSRAEVVSTLLPTSLPSGWSTVTGSSPVWTFPSPALCPQLKVTDAGAFNNNTFGSLIGFALGTYPTVDTANATVLGTFTPTVEPINQIVIGCSLTNNPSVLTTPNYIYSFNANGYAGSQSISLEPKWPSYYPCSLGPTSKITVFVVDQDGNDIFLVDPNATFVINIRPKNSIS